MTKHELAPGVYEQAFGRGGNNAHGLVPFYAGEAQHLWERLKSYGGGGDHICDVYSQAACHGLCIFVRWRRLGSKSEALQEERRMLGAFDYAGNMKNNGSRRIQQVLGRFTSSGVGLLDMMVDDGLAYGKNWVAGQAASLEQHAAEVGCPPLTLNLNPKL